MFRNMLSRACKTLQSDGLQSMILGKSDPWDGRLAERTRIAQALHDTALQDFIVASMQVEVAMDWIPQSSPAALQLFKCRSLLIRGIEEIRRTLQGLRSQETECNDLVQALRIIPREFGVEPDFDFQFVVTGRARKLDPVVRDQVYRIAHEVLANALRHSGAKRIEIELIFAARNLKLRVRDNGRGMNSRKVLGGLSEHFGLLGMHERAEQIGAKLEVWSRIGAGTEIALTIPNSIAFKSEEEDCRAV